MNEEKRQENLVRLQQIFLNRNFVNKTNMLKVVNSSYATSKRRDEANIKFDIPVPTHTLEFKRSSSAYFHYYQGYSSEAVLKYISSFKKLS